MIEQTDVPPPFELVAQDNHAQLDPSNAFPETRPPTLEERNAVALKANGGAIRMNQSIASTLSIMSNAPHQTQEKYAVAFKGGDVARFDQSTAYPASRASTLSFTSCVPHQTQEKYAVAFKGGDVARFDQSTAYPASHAPTLSFTSCVPHQTKMRGGY